MPENRITARQINTIVTLGLVYLFVLCFYDYFDVRFKLFSSNDITTPETQISESIAQIIPEKVHERIDLPVSKGKFLFDDMSVREESVHRYHIVIPVKLYTGTQDTLVRECIVKLTYTGGELEDGDSWDISGITLTPQKGDPVF